MYLDYAASTPLSTEVKNKLMELVDVYGNPSSIHDEGVKAHKVIEEATEIIANHFSCNKTEIHYTSGATMSNNLAIQGFLKANPNGRIVISEIEHNDIMLLCKSLKDKVNYVSVNSLGIINTSELKLYLDKYKNIPVLCSIQSANGEIGTIQNIKEISEIIHSYPDSYFHTDATQYVPYFKMDLSSLNIDVMSFSGQKIRCIKGIGVLYVKDGTPISPIIYGEQGLIGGTENVIGIGCLGEAIKNLHSDHILLKEKREYLLNKLSGLGRLVGSEYRVPNNICFCFDAIPSDVMVMALNEHDIYVSAGSACSSKSGEVSHVLKAIGLYDDAENCIRITFNEDQELDSLISEIVGIRRMLCLE